MKKSTEQRKPVAKPWDVKAIAKKPYAQIFAEFRALRESYRDVNVIPPEHLQMKINL